jgi:hypothetical protein
LKETEDNVNITLDLKPEVEAGLLAQARSAGLSLSQFLSRELEGLAPSASTPFVSAVSGGSDQWERELDSWFDSFPQHPVLNDEALRRESWYPDRW